MGLDDPIVIMLILGIVIMLFGSKKIPELARSLGQAKKAFYDGTKGILEDNEQKGRPETK